MVSSVVVDDDEKRRLRRLNAGFGALHGVQALAMIALSNSRSLPITGVFANGQPGQPDGPLEVDQLFSYRLGWAVALSRSCRRRFTWSSLRPGASTGT